MARGQILTIPNQTAQLVTTLSREQKASLSMLNPNDGVCYVKINGAASQNVAGWDWKVPSQSYCQLPGPWESLGVYYLDQSGSGRTAEVNVYELDSQIAVPSFIAIGRAVQSAGTTLDISQGNQPQSPPASTTRLWVDSNGDLHLLSPTGSDNLVYDQSNIGSVALGGDLRGTIGTAIVSLRNQQPLYGHLGDGTEHGLIRVTSANTTQVASMGNGFQVTSTDFATGLMYLDINGQLTVNAGIISSAGGLNVNQNATVAGGVLTLGSVTLQNWSPTGMLRNNTGGIQTAGDIILESDHIVQFAVNGYGWKGINGYAVVYTSGNIGSGGGSLYLSSALTDRLYWDGSGFHITKYFITDGYFYGRGGILYLGSSDQSSFSMWNPGEIKLTSSPGNFLATGYVQAVGNYVAGNGAYINTASSRDIKHNIVELNSRKSLEIILDERMRPIEFEYITPPPRQRHTTIDETEPNPNAPDIIWPDTKLGFIAEEVSQVVPQAAGKIEGTDLGIHLSVEMLVPVLWSAVRELDARIKRLENQRIAA